MKWDYKIAKTDLGYKVYRIGEENGVIKMEWLQNGAYTWNKEFAKTFYHLNDATSALVVARAKGETPITSIKKSESEGIKEKKSWSEL